MVVLRGENATCPVEAHNRSGRREKARTHSNTHTAPAGMNECINRYDEIPDVKSRDLFSP